QRIGRLREGHEPPRVASSRLHSERQGLCEPCVERDQEAPLRLCRGQHQAVGVSPLHLVHGTLYELALRELAPATVLSRLLLEDLDEVLQLAVVVDEV